MEIGTYAELLKDHRAVFKMIKDPLQIYEIAAYHEGKRYLVFDVSRWLEEDDGEKIIVHVSSRALKDNPAFFFNCCRDQMFNLCVDVRGIPRYIVEPRVSGGRWLAARLGLPDREAWREAVLGGRLHTAMQAGHPDELEDERDAALRRARIQRKRVRRRDAELAMVRGTLADQQAAFSENLGELCRVKDDRMTRANQLVSCEARVRQLMEALEAASVPIPPWQQPPPWQK